MKILVKTLLILLLGLFSMSATATQNVIWKPQPGSQELFLSCPIFECLYEGTRGPGKTDALLMDFAQFVGQGHGAAWRGILFRNEYKHLEDVITKSQKWFPRIFPDAFYNESKYMWKFGTGERLYFRHAKRESDYWNYHGHEYPWIAWEELTNWADDCLYLKMMSVCRSSTAGMPRRYRATCNPFGPGHNWVKDRFIDPAPRGVIIQDKDGRDRVCLHGSIWENKILLESDPEYLKNLQAQSGATREAWLYGNWDIVAGGMFDDVWDAKIHIISPFKIPATWRLDRSFDWGSSKPYSVGWWAESDGCDIKLADGSTRSTRPGDLFRIAELYGCTGKPNVGTKELAKDVAVKVREYEKDVLCREVSSGPADSSIYDKQDNHCIADNMSAEGINWTKAEKGPGSRINGWEQVRERLKNSISKEGPGLFVFDNCRHFIRTVPVLPRDEKKPDDVNCFVAGTKVNTLGGLKNIEEVNRGESVMTPLGFREVLRSGPSGQSETVKVVFSDGREIEGTPDHKIFIDNVGLVPLCNLKNGMEATLTSWQPKKQFTTESSIESMMEEDILSAILPQVNDLEKLFCTGRSGETLSEKSRQSTTSTTKTKMQKTTESKILNAFRSHCTASNITTSEQTLQRLSKNGLGLIKESVSCVKMLRKCIETRPSMNMRAMYVKACLKLSRLGRNTALVNVLKSLVGPEALEKHAQYAEQYFSVNQVPRKKTKLAVINVVGRCENKTVYNLTTRQAHLYYVDGLLVSNTDAEDHIADELRYRLSVKKHETHRN